MPKYRILENFETIQGEGQWCGTPVHLIRFAGCNLSCSFCDTKVNNDATIMDDNAIVNAIRLSHVLITGGEPLLNDIVSICEKIRTKIIMLETNGTVDVTPIRNLVNHICISPKGRYLKSNFAMADEIKLLLTHENKKDILNIIKTYPFHNISIQPLWGEPKLMAEAINIAIQHDIRLSVQIHKYIGVR